MKKKISVFALLLSLLLAVLVGLVPPGSAKANITETTADDIKYRDIEDFLESRGYIGFEKKEECKYLAYIDYRNYVYVYEVDSIDAQNPYWCYRSDNIETLYMWSDVGVDANKCRKYSFYNLEECAENDCYGYFAVENNGYGNYAYYKNNWRGYRVVNITVDNIAYSDLDIYQCGYELQYSSEYYTPKYIDLLYENSVSEVFTFPVWCDYAGLNCLSSTNESLTKIPYSYNDYWHVVRRTSSGKWLLTTIGNSKNQQDMQLRLSEDLSKLIIYNVYEDDGTDSSYNGYLANVRQYEYDTDGWKVRSYETIDFSDTEEVTVELEVGTGLDDTRLLAYTNTDIYSFNGYAILHEASTEYYEVTDTPTVTPEPTPDSGSSGSDDSGSSDSGSSGAGRPGSGTRPSVGGEASGGGGLDFIINLFTLIWTKICSIPMQVDGYSISLQQIFVYGALVGIVGGFIMKFIFGRR